MVNSHFPLFLLVEFLFLFNIGNLDTYVYNASMLFNNFPHTCLKKLNNYFSNMFLWQTEIVNKKRNSAQLHKFGKKNYYLLVDYVMDFLNLQPIRKQAHPISTITSESLKNATDCSRKDLVRTNDTTTMNFLHWIIAATKFSFN